MTKHLLKERKGDRAITACGVQVETAEATVWWRDVTCLDCSLIIKPIPGQVVRRRVVTVRSRAVK